jgi:hypothetical protein
MHCAVITDLLIIVDMQTEGYVTVEQVEKEFSWSTGRAIDALETLLKVILLLISVIAICLDYYGAKGKQ